MSFTCAIVTPSDAVLDTPATYASFEAWDGQQGVATGASAFLTKLGTGIVTCRPRAARSASSCSTAVSPRWTARG